MLVVTRGVGESLTFHDDAVRLTVTKIRRPKEIVLVVHEKVASPTDSTAATETVFRCAEGDVVEIKSIQTKINLLRTGTNQLRVRLGIIAPREISVHRLEIWQLIRNQHDK